MTRITIEDKGEKAKVLLMKLNLMDAQVVSIDP